MKYAMKVVCLAIVFIPINHLKATHTTDTSRATPVHHLIQGAVGLILCTTARRSGTSIIHMFRNTPLPKGLTPLMRQSEAAAYHLICSATTAGAGMMLINKGAEGLINSLKTPFLLEIVNEQIQNSSKNAPGAKI